MGSASSAVTVRTGYATYGLGSLVATFLATAMGIWMVRRNLPRLEFLVLRQFGRLSLGRKSHKGEDIAAPAAVEPSSE